MLREISYHAQVLKLTLLARLVWMLWWYHDWCYRNVSRTSGDTVCARDCLQAAQEMCSEVFELRMKRQSLGLLHATRFKRTSLPDHQIGQDPINPEMAEFLDRVFRNTALRRL